VREPSGRPRPPDPLSAAEVAAAGARLAEVFGARVRPLAPLANVTTFRTGGAADWLVEKAQASDLAAAIRIANVVKLPLTVLGGGSNVLVADAGVRGLVVRLRHGAISRTGAGTVRADGGVTVNHLVRWTIRRGLSGLERWAGTPGTVGGAIRGNVHFEGRLIGDAVTAVGLVDRGGAEIVAPRASMGFGYDDSRVQHSGELVRWAEFRVGPGASAGLRAAARRSLAFRKRTQPLGLASAGCVFQNPRPEDGRLPDGLPRSAGALIEHAGLKGRRIGGATVSPLHANFIVNAGGAAARDVRRLIEACRTAVADRFGVLLRDEVVYLGDFDPESAP
jgi:UDP-N-acetylmuramate dehydrogenase